jgi:hypothetical protein
VLSMPRQDIGSYLGLARNGQPAAVAHAARRRDPGSGKSIASTSRRLAAGGRDPSVATRRWNLLSTVSNHVPALILTLSPAKRALYRK